MRKRVTRVGSGAYSIYLPKKWIDGWPAEQRERREVDLHRIDDLMLIMPVVRTARVERQAPDDATAVTGLLLSAYVRGVDEVVLRPAEGRFGTETQVRARDVLRHTDERIVAHVGPDGIGYILDGGLPAPFSAGADLLGVLGARVREVLRLGADAVDTYATDPERALHALQMARSIHEQDVARLWHQALRLVARIELPLAGVTEFQLLDLTASGLQAASGQLLHIAQAVLGDWGLRPEELEYPRAHLLAKRKDPGPMPPLARGLVRPCRRGLEQAVAGLEEAVAALARRDVAGLAAAGVGLRQAQAALQDGIVEATLENWGQSDHRPHRSITASRITQPVGDIHASLARMCERAVLLLAAEAAA